MVVRDGFSLNAVVAFAAHEREGIEGLCRYVTRPALALERLSTNGAGQVEDQRKAPYRDGATHFVFEPLDVLARLAALVPRPRGNRFRCPGRPFMSAIGAVRHNRYSGSTLSIP
jgi:hypothetical protein